MRDYSAKIPFQSFLLEAIVSKVPRRMVFEKLPKHATCPKHAGVRPFTVARRGSRGPAGQLILLRTQSLVLCSK